MPQYSARHVEILSIAAVLGLLCPSLPALAAPLFESDETLAIVLELPVDDVLQHAKEKPTVDAKLRHLESDVEIVLDLSVTTRGKSRLKQCRYPPLSLNLKKKQAASTIFEGQNKLKLVVPCRGTQVSRRYVNQEYAVYRAYRLLTDYSFRVRKLAVTFRDTNGRHKDATHDAFVIEPIKAAAERLGMEVIKSPRVRVSQLDPQQLSTLALFQFMIGNTDWSARQGPPSEDCCHNGKVLGDRDSADGWVVLPYDFDQAGIINTDYSAPAEQLRLRSVRQRLYRGYCRPIDQMDSTIALFNDRRAALESLFGNATAQESANKTALKYLDSFFDIINDPAKRKKKIVDACLQTGD